MALEIATEMKITYYDAVFVALAEKLGATLVTASPKHHVKNRRVRVVPLDSYK